MTSLDVACAGCGSEFTLEFEGESHWLRMMAARVRCDECSAKQEAHEAERERVQAREARRTRCQLPNSLRGELLTHFQPLYGQAAAFSAAREWAAIEDPGGLLLTGEVGVGKTRLAAAACWTRLERWPCTYASVARAMARLGASFTDEGRREAVRVFAGNGPVVLDDFDKGRPSDFGREQLFAAVDGRYQSGAPMLVTTNLTPSQIGERFGESIMSRLAEYCRVVQMVGGDRRLEKRSTAVKAA